MVFSHDLIITTFNSYKYLDNLYLFIFENLNKYSNILIIDDCSTNDFYQLLVSKSEDLITLLL